MTIEFDEFDLFPDLGYLGVEFAKPPIPPKPIEKPQKVPPIRIPENQKKHITKSGK